MTISKHDWPRGAELTIDAVRALHQPAEHYRISLNSYPAGTAFPGTARAGRCYILSGACTFRYGDSSVQFVAPCYFDYPEGGFHFSVDSSIDVSLIDVWLLPPEFRRDNS